MYKYIYEMESQLPATSKPSNEEETSPKTPETYRKIISTLPREDGWKAHGDLCLYQNFWCYSYFIEGAMLAQDHYNAQPTDIFLCSFPKSGTTWLKALTFSVVTRTHFDNSTTPLLFKGPHNCLPLLEIDFCRKGMKPEPGSLPLVASHLPYASLPKSINDSGCKIVYICREPKDAFVSMWHYTRKLPHGVQEPMSLEEAFELFCKGVSDFGPYWDHVLGFWKASLERPEKILFLKYEDMMRETLLYVKQMAEFMGYPFSLEEENKGKIRSIVEFCSFENLSNLEINKTGKYAPDIPVENKSFFRKGKVGDWKNYLMREMAEHLDEITKQKLGRFDLSFDDV
ncbi:flavonol sulfotransferase-like isoform X1 [Pistacia vera]|uniref:flavonol sulfotransferase-like isoform X1 n=2 Tax=Pistacia vera TaxID=55513 RepID=UPI0012633FB2|nr:flavonol sulfotransferase-like isoform X1 [Pistacia vera]